MAESQKWWFDTAQASGASLSGSLGESTEPQDPGASPPAGGLNIGALMLGAQQLAEWASELVLAPHAEHLDPREHAECLICRGQQLLTSPIVQSAVANAAAGAVQFAAPSARPARAAESPCPTERLAQRSIEWIPVERRGA